MMLVRNRVRIAFPQCRQQHPTLQFSIAFVEIASDPAFCHTINSRVLNASGPRTEPSIVILKKSTETQPVRQAFFLELCRVPGRVFGVLPKILQAFKDALNDLDRVDIVPCLWLYTMTKSPAFLDMWPGETQIFVEMNLRWRRRKISKK
jgi:hypothetical protein